MREYLKRDVDDARRKALARVGVDAVCKMIFHDNLLHGDLHPGNILVTPAGELAFLDAGIAIAYSQSDHHHLVRDTDLRGGPRQDLLRAMHSALTSIVYRGGGRALEQGDFPTVRSPPRRA